jgi:hypothetical protein
VNITPKIASRSLLGLFLALLFAFSVCEKSSGQNTKGSDGKACPKRWKTHICAEGTVLCVDPEVELKYDFAEPFRHAQCNPKVHEYVIPNSSIRGDPYLYGFSMGYKEPPGFWMRTLMLDSSMVQDGDVAQALSELGLPERSHGWDRQFANASDLGLSVYNMAVFLGDASRPHPTDKVACSPPSLVHVCSSMILLCVAPQTEQNFKLADSDSFQAAYCDARPLADPVPAADITGDPYKAGFSVGFAVLPRKFVKVTNLSSDQKSAENLEEVLKRLDLSIPPDWETKFDEGIDAGADALRKVYDEAVEKAKRMAK